MRTIISDVDGTLVKHMHKGHKGIMEEDHEVLPGVVEKMRAWEA